MKIYTDQNRKKKNLALLKILMQLLLSKRLMKKAVVFDKGGQRLTVKTILLTSMIGVLN